VRTSLVSFNLAGHDPLAVAEALNTAGVESRAGCHCATLAHHKLRLDPPASCRLSFYLYNTLDDVDRAVDAVAAVATRRHRAVLAHRPGAAPPAIAGLGSMSKRTWEGGWLCRHT
jgi:cysteine desulfurase / selenocysteine lyase